MELLFTYAGRFGRIARATWLYRLLLLGMLCTALGMLAENMFGSSGAALFSFLFVWCASACSIQRLHDTGRSGWYMLSVLIPVLGPLFLLWLLLRRGNDGGNTYGPHPLMRRDYLQVDITK